jgi:hypothetical protein
MIYGKIMKNAPVLSDSLFFSVQQSELGKEIYRLEVECGDSGECNSSRVGENNKEVNLLSFVYPLYEAHITCRLEWEDCGLDEIPKKVHKEWLKFLAEIKYSIFSLGYVLSENIWIYEEWYAANDYLQCMKIDYLDEFVAARQSDALDDYEWVPTSRQKAPEMDVVFQGLHPIRLDQLKVAQRAYMVGVKSKLTHPKMPSTLS